MNIKPVNTEADYRAALKDIELLMMAKAGSSEGDRLDELTTLIEAYEAKHYPIDMPDPIEAIKFEMEQQELSIKDLEPMIGRRSRVYEVLAHKRGLSLNMIRNLNQGLGIPAEILIQPSIEIHA